MLNQPSEKDKWLIAKTNEKEKEKSVQYEYAADGETIIHISEAKRHTAYTCPNEQCRGEMYSHKGPVKAHHFHHTSAPDHGGETAIHFNIKYGIYRLLTDAIENNYDAIITTKICPLCERLHTTCLLSNAATVMLERKVGPIIPDVSIEYACGKVGIAFEIVNTHDQSRESVEYMKENGIVCIKIEASEEYLKELRNAKVQRGIIKIPSPKESTPIIEGLCEKCADSMNKIDRYHKHVKELKKAGAILLDALKSLEQASISGIRRKGIMTEITEEQINEFQKRGAIVTSSKAGKKHIWYFPGW